MREKDIYRRYKKYTLNRTLTTVLFALLLLSEGCQHTEENKTIGSNIQNTPAPQEPQTSKAWEKPTTTRETPWQTTRRLYLSDLMKNGQFSIPEVFRRAIREENSGYLRYDLLHHGKPKTIFHHPIYGQNNIMFQAIPIKKGTIFRFNIGLFTEGRKDFCSDGAGFTVLINDGLTERVVFKEQLDPQQFDAWQDDIVDLSEYAMKNISISLITEPLQGNGCDWTCWGTPRLVYPPDEEYEIPKESDAALFTSIISNYDNIPLSHGENRADRGWFAHARTTDIYLSDVKENTIIQTEIYIVEQSGKEEEIVIEFLDKNETVISSSHHKLNHHEQMLYDKYEVATPKPFPTKIRIRLDSENSSVVFIKEPVQYALRVADQENPRPHVILISLDTLRADRLGCYGYDSDTSPNIDALAKESFVFTRTYSSSSWTLPAHLSMFTSLYPVEHQAFLKYMASSRTLDDPHYYITEAFKEAGYVTIAFTGGGLVNSRYGFNKGVDYHIEEVKEFNMESLNTLLHLIQSNKDAPMFVFFHTYEIHDYFNEKPSHWKYIPNDFVRKNQDVPLINIINILAHNALTQGYDKPKEALLPESEVQYVRNLYDGAIFYTDALLGDFFHELRSMGIYDNAWIIVTSDHGEGFGEKHDNDTAASWHHAYRIYNEQLHVPLIIKPPKHLMQELPAPRTIDQLTSIIDIPPTLVSILEQNSNKQFKGKDLLPLMKHNKQLSEDVTFAEDLRWRQFAIIDNDYKLIVNPLNEFLVITGFRYELYHITNDPFEKVNLIGSPEHVSVYHDLKQRLDQHIQDLLAAGYSKVPFSIQTPSTIEETEETPETPAVEVDKNHIKRLKDLGYL